MLCIRRGCRFSRPDVIMSHMFCGRMSAPQEVGTGAGASEDDVPPRIECRLVCAGSAPVDAMQSFVAGISVVWVLALRADMPGAIMLPGRLASMIFRNREVTGSLVPAIPCLCVEPAKSVGLFHMTLQPAGNVVVSSEDVPLVHRRAPVTAEAREGVLHVALQKGSEAEEPCSPANVILLSHLGVTSVLTLVWAMYHREMEARLHGHHDCARPLRM